MKKLNSAEYKQQLALLKAKNLPIADYKKAHKSLLSLRLTDNDYKKALVELRNSKLFDGFNVKDGYDLRAKKPFNYYKKTVIEKHLKILEFVNNKTLNGQFDAIHLISKNKQPTSAIKTLNNALGYSHPDAKHLMSEKLKYIILPKLPNQKIKSVKSQLIVNTEPVLNDKGEPVLLKNGQPKLKEKDRIYRAIVNYDDLKLAQVITFIDTKKVTLNTDYGGDEDDIKDSLKTEYEREIYRVMGDIDDGLNSYRLSSFGGDINPQYTPSPFLDDMAENIGIMIEKYKTKEDLILRYVSGVSAWRTTKGKNINDIPNYILGHQFTTHDRKQRR